MKKLTVKTSRDNSGLIYVSAGVTIKEMIMKNNAEYILQKSISDEVFYRLSSEKDLKFSDYQVSLTEIVLTWEN